MKAAEFRVKSHDSLIEELASLRKSFFVARFQRSTGQLADTSKLRKIRRSIARLRTVLREKDILIAAEKGRKNG